MGFADVQALIKTATGVSPSPTAGAPLGSPTSPGAPVGEQDGPWGLLLQGLDILARPGRAVSEGVGGLQEGEDFFEGMQRGIKGDYRYGTIGEQLIPETEGVDKDPLEEFFKMGARLAIDIATDPLTYAFVGPLKKPAMMLLAVPGRAGGKVASVAAKKMPGMQAISEKLLPVTTHLRLWGNDVAKGRTQGTKLADGFEAMHRKARVPSGIEENNLLKASKAFDIHRSKDHPARLMAVEHVESGALRQGIIHEDPRVQKFAEWLRDNMNETGDAVEKWTDLNKEGFKVFDPKLQRAQGVLKRGARRKNIKDSTKEEMWDAYVRGDATFNDSNFYREMKRKLDDVGAGTDVSPWKGDAFYARPFTKRQDYAPWMLTDEAMKKYRNLKESSPIVMAFAKKNGLTQQQAHRLLKRYAQPQKAGNIEYARTLEFPKGDLEKDPLKYLPRYYERLYNRMAFGNEFGLNGSRLENLITGAKNNGLSEKFADAIEDVAKGKRARDYALDSAARKIMGFQVMTKMGPLSALSNISQNVNTFVRDGGIAFTKGILRSTSDEGGRAGVIAWQRGIHDEFLRIAGGEGSVANKYLTWTGFNKAESINRLLASNSSIVAAERNLAAHFAAGGTAQKLPEKLIRRGISEDDAMNYLKNGNKLAQGSADKIGFIGSQATQHATAWKDLPLIWQEPEWRIMLQYKSFIYQQSRFLGREVLGQAQRYFRTAGKEGSIGPLIRAGVGFGISAEVVHTLRNQAKTQVGKLVGLEQPPQEFDEDHPLWQLMMHSQYVGALGMAGDIVERTTRRDLAGWMLGPTIGDMTDLFEGVPTVAKDIQQQGVVEGMPWRKAWQEIRRRIPGIGTLFPRGARAGEDYVEQGTDYMRRSGYSDLQRLLREQRGE